MTALAPQGPFASVEPEQTAYAGFWWRALALVLDGFLIQIAYVPVQILLGFLSQTPFSIFASNPADMALRATALSGTVLIALLGHWLYYALFESSRYQATPGKMICRLIVTDQQGQRISFGRASGRYFATILSSLTLCIGYLMVCWTRRKQALHDILAGTLVLRRLPPPFYGPISTP